MISNEKYSKLKGLNRGLVVNSEFNTPSLNGTWIMIVGDYGYDRDGRAYQNQGEGWVCVCNRTLPMTVAGEAQTKKVLRN